MLAAGLSADHATTRGDTPLSVAVRLVEVGVLEDAGRHAVQFGRSSLIEDALGGDPSLPMLCISTQMSLLPAHLSPM